MKLDIVSGIKLILKANRKIVEERLWQQWNLEHLFMDENNFISYKDYIYKAFNTKPEDKLTKEKIMKQVDKINADFKDHKFKKK